ncbi:MAG: hypothetical protein ACREQE_11010, partial [Candidatus Binataceae bacterium]
MLVLVCLIGFILSVLVVSLYCFLFRNRYRWQPPVEMPLLGVAEGTLEHSMLRPEPCRTVRVYFIKPSKYDDLGYVQFFRFGVQPNNTLTVLNALNDRFNQRYST